MVPNILARNDKQPQRIHSDENIHNLGDNIVDSQLEKEVETEIKGFSIRSMIQYLSPKNMTEDET